MEPRLVPFAPQSPEPGTARAQQVRVRGRGGKQGLAGADTTGLGEEQRDC